MIAENVNAHVNLPDTVCRYNLLVKIRGGGTDHGNYVNKSIERVFLLLGILITCYITFANEREAEYCTASFCYAYG